jgi:hypothetical protein
LDSRSARQKDKKFDKDKKFEKDKKFDKDRGDKKWYCRFFNRDECDHTEYSHKAIVYDQERTVFHFCSACWKNGKGEIVKHAATSEECPNKD